MRVDLFVPTKEELQDLNEDDAWVRDILGVDGKDKMGTCENSSSITEDYVSLEVEDEVKTEGEVNSSTSEEEKTKSVDDEVFLKELHEKFNYFNLPSNLQKLLLAADKPLPFDFTVPIDKRPDWFDLKKFKMGQLFAKKYFIGLNAADMLSTVVLFTFPDILEPLIYTENSGTPYTAFRRYFGTVLKVTSWYDNNIWKKDNPGYRNLRTVRALHLTVSKRMNSKSYKDLENKVSLIESSDNPDIWSDQKNVLLQDFQSSCPFRMVKPFDNKRSGKVFISQLDMSITQFAFVGLMVTYPSKFGAASASKQELEGFLHMWRSIGYLLGIKDEYNFCDGSLEEVIERCHSVIDHWVKPNLQHVTEDWEHMSRCMLEGMSYILTPMTTFEPVMMYLCWVLDVPTLRFYKSLTWKQKNVYFFIKFMLNLILRLPGMLPLHNWILRFALKKASALSPEDLKKMKEKKYDYQVQRVDDSMDLEDQKSSLMPLLTLVYVVRLLV